MDISEKIEKKLFEMQDMEYRNFQCKLIPNVNPESVIGVRTPELRKLANRLSKTADAEEFIKVLPHKYYEENNLHACLIEKIKDFDKALRSLDAFLPYVDNWATCDMLSPVIFKKHTAQLYNKIKVWINCKQTYTVRFAIGMLMKFYLDDAFDPQVLELAANVKSEEYYVNMMTAWFFATALAKQYGAALPYLQQKRLPKWTHNKSIQKAIESSRITPVQKEYLRTLKC